MKIQLNPEQQSALDAMTSFLLDEDKRNSPYFLLSELKSRLTTETDPLTKQLLKDKIKSTSQLLFGFFPNLA